MTNSNQENEVTAQQKSSLLSDKLDITNPMPSHTAIQTKPIEAKYYAIKKLGLRLQQQHGLTQDEIDGIEIAAAEYLKNEENIEAAERLAKAAVAHVRMMKKAGARTERTLLAESAVILEAARAEAESAERVPITTSAATYRALKIARTARQRLSLIMRLSAHQKTMAQRAGS